MEIKIKYLRDIKPLDIIENGDWIDLRAGEDITMIAGDYRLIPLGIAMELPKGYSAIIAPRSSTFKKWKIICANSIGIIDESYCGDNDEWHFPVIAFGTTKIHKNDRICQFRVIKKEEPIDFIRVKILGNENRNGFGSTGEN